MNRPTTTPTTKLELASDPYSRAVPTGYPPQPPYSPPRRVVAGVVGFGAGVLVSALTFDLMREAFDTGGAWYAVGGFLLGAVIYVLADVGLERMAAKSPKRTGRDATNVVPGAEHKPESPQVAAVAGTPLLAGALIDGIPESIAIGGSLHAEGPGLGLVLLAGGVPRQRPGELGQRGRDARRGPLPGLHRGRVDGGRAGVRGRDGRGIRAVVGICRRG